MLTILEAYNIIKALDTEPDIIAGACKKVLGQDKKEEDDPNSLAREIVLTYCDRIAPHLFVATLAVATGIVAGLAAKEGHETELLEQIHEVIIEQMLEVSVKKFQEKIKKDPKGAIESMLRRITDRGRD